MRPIDADALKRRIEKVAAREWEHGSVSRCVVLGQAVDFIDSEPTIELKQSEKERVIKMDDTMEIYVVTQGAHSEYGIIAVCTDLETAENICRRCYDEGRIEVYEANSSEESLVYNYYFIAGPATGELTIIHEGDYYCDIKTEYNIGAATPGDLQFAFSCFAIDAEHAMKIAYDKRAQKIAELAGL